MKQGLGRRAVDPPGLKREQMLASYLPYVTGVGEDVLMLRDGDVMASFLVAGVEADTADETFVADVARAFGSTVAQLFAPAAPFGNTALITAVCGSVVRMFSIPVSRLLCRSVRRPLAGS